MIYLNSSVRLVMLQFRFSNHEAIPWGVLHRKPETVKEQNVRKNGATGKLVIEPTLNCSVAEFLDELETVGYELVDAFYQERIHAQDNSKTYHTTRFTFARTEHATPSQVFRETRHFMRADLRTICTGAMWGVRAFSNPFYQNGEDVPSQSSLCINLEARVPLFRPDGTPVVVWHKDDRGRRLGDAPLPLIPEYGLRVEGNIVNLVKM